MSDAYVVLDLATTCDESSNYVAKDSSEIIELAWKIIDAETLLCINEDSVLVRPVNTPITPYCTNLYNIDWELVRNAGTFKDAIAKFDGVITTVIKDKQFSFVTFDIFKLRVQLSREARDKSVVLPMYLQHPRIFDLQQEYTKWQATHPEALGYSASSIGNIMTALAVDDVQSGHGNQTSQNGQPEDSEKTSAENDNGTDNGTGPGQSTVSKCASLYLKILVQLIKKSLPVGDHPLVLTKPYDSSQDVKVFLSERSKILFLCNLPVDTTQSELESWFTQYGGRPIAFWTLKNLDMGDGGSTGSSSVAGGNGNCAIKGKPKGISGFAVFATHEEATESLSMNGRVLNDRPIEVQPSSTRVLDNAADLLTPFPPSKNRPRPGDWTCPSCGFSNFQRRTHCFRCSFPASSAVAIQESMYSSTRRGNNGNNSTSTSNNNSNDKLAYNSSMAKSGSGGVMNNQYFDPTQSYSQSNTPTNSGPASSNGHNNHHHTNYYNNSGNANGGRGHYGNNVPFRAGDWKCELCTYHNFAKNLCCLKCSAAKPILNVSNQQTSIHSVNTTAAAIAAATASGQALNLNGGFMGLQQPQPRHVYSQGNQPQGANQGQPQGGARKPANNANIVNKPGQQYQPGQQAKAHNVRGNSNGTPQPGQQQQQQQHYSMMAPSQSQSSQSSQSSQTYKFSQPVQGANTMYSNYGNTGQYGTKGTNGANGANGANGGNDSSTSLGSSSLMNPAFGMLAGQMGGLSLNH